MNQKKSFQKFAPLAALVLSASLVGTAYAQAPAAPAPSGKVVLKVGNEQFTQEDLDFLVGSLSPQAQRSLSTQGRRGLGDQFAMMIILEQQAISQHLDASPDFVRRLAYQKRQLLAQAEYEELVKKTTVSEEETSQYYASHPAEFNEMQLREVIIRKRAADSKEGDPGLTADEAKARAEAIRKALTGATDIKKVREDYQVPDVVIIDGEPRTVRQNSLRPEMEKAASQLKDGELSENFDVPQAIVFFQMLGRRRAELKDVTTEIGNTLRQEKIEAVLADLRKKSNVWMDEQYFAPPAGAAAETSGETPSQQ